MSAASEDHNNGTSTTKEQEEEVSEAHHEALWNEFHKLFRCSADNNNDNNNNDNDKQLIQEEIVTLLQRHPSLCLEGFAQDPACLSGNTMLRPLVIMLMEHFSLEQIQAVVQLDPSQLRKSPSCRKNLLHFGIENNVEFPVLEFLAKSYPPALLENDSFGNLPIHTFLFSKLGNPNRIMEWEKTIQMMVNLEPKCLYRSRTTGYIAASCLATCLDIAIYVKCPHDIVQWMVDHSNPNTHPELSDSKTSGYNDDPMKHVTVSSLLRSGQPIPGHPTQLMSSSSFRQQQRLASGYFMLDEFAATSIGILLASGRVEKMTLTRSVRWSNAGFTALMHHLVGNHTRRQQSVEYLRMALPRDSPEAASALRGFLQQNQSLKQIYFDGPVVWGEDRLQQQSSCELLLQAIMDGMQGNKTIHSMATVGMTLQAPERLLELLRIGSCDFTRIFSMGFGSTGTLQHNSAIYDNAAYWQSCSIPKIILQDLKGIDAACYNRLLSTLALIPSLEALHLRQTNGDDDDLEVTEAIQRYLMHCNNLHTLEISGAYITTDRLRASLMENKSLKNFNFDTTDGLPELRQNILQVLSEHNTTLTQVHWTRKARRYSHNGATPGFVEELALLGKVGYYAKLNKWGRPVARDGNTSLSELVNLLCVLASAPENQIDSLDKPCMFFGLLRMTPGLWTTTTAARRRGTKRKLGAWMNQEKEEKPVTVLVLGDGDFSYSYDLARHLLATSELHPNRSLQLVATGLDSHESLTEKYKDACFLLKQLTRLDKSPRLRPKDDHAVPSSTNLLHVSVHHGVNAIHQMTNQSDNLPTATNGDIPKAHHVVFNHPHLGREDAVLHSQFLCHLFHSVSTLWLHTTTSATSEKSINNNNDDDNNTRDAYFHLTLVAGQYERWNCRQAAERHGMMLINQRPFRAPQVPNPYYQQRRHQSGKSFAARAPEGSMTYTFVRKHSPNSQDNQQDRTRIDNPDPDVGEFVAKLLGLELGTSSLPVGEQGADHNYQELEFSCPFCEKSFREERSRKSHIKALHGEGNKKRKRDDDTNEEEGEEVIMQHSCSLCLSRDGKGPRMFRNEQALVDHQKAKHAAKHDVIKPDWHSTNKGSHSNSHDGGRQQESNSTIVNHFGSCEICGLVFCSSTSRIDHAQAFVPSDAISSVSKPEVLPFECTFCRKRFLESRAQLQHENFCSRRSVDEATLQC